MAIPSETIPTLQKILDSYEKGESTRFSICVDGNQETVKMIPIPTPKPSHIQMAPPVGLECYQHLYDTPVDSIAVLEQCAKIISEEKHIFQALLPSEKPTKQIGTSSTGKLSIECMKIIQLCCLEIVRLLEAKNEVSLDLCQKIKQLLINLEQVSNEKIPKEFNIRASSIHDLLGLTFDFVQNEPHITYLKGPQTQCHLYASIYFLIKKCLGLHQIFSTKFAKELLICFEHFPNKYLELASGRGMLSAAIKSVGSRGIVATDIDVPKPTFNDFPVFKKSAKKLLNGYTGNKPIYFISEPIDSLMKEICHTALEQNEPIMIVTIGFLFNKLFQQFTGGLAVIELTIPDYAQLRCDCGVQLLLFNHNSQQIQACKEKVPSKYLQFQPASRHQLQA
ncbi:MAG: hypothetical protein HAW66_05780 [Shewanella sp.]|nr:hypothetical protein [Shewanella sp.]